MLLSQAGPALTGIDWTQFGVAGVMLLVLSAYIWHLTKHNREIADNHDATVKKIAEESQATSKEITDRFIELHTKSSEQFIKLHTDALESIRKDNRSE